MHSASHTQAFSPVCRVLATIRAGSRDDFDGPVFCRLCPTDGGISGARGGRSRQRRARCTPGASPRDHPLPGRAVASFGSDRKRSCRQRDSIRCPLVPAGVCGYNMPRFGRDFRESSGGKKKRIRSAAQPGKQAMMGGLGQILPADSGSTATEPQVRADQRTRHAMIPASLPMWLIEFPVGSEKSGRFLPYPIKSPPERDGFPGQDSARSGEISR